jgi:hypothetical protein
MKISVMLFWLSFVTLFFVTVVISCDNESEKTLDLSNATILLSHNIKSPVRESAGEILREEIARRTSLQLKTSDSWSNETVIACALSSDQELYGETLPKHAGSDLPEFKKEGYRLYHEVRNSRNILWIIGADPRGILYGIGKLLATSIMKDKQIQLRFNIDIASSPEFSLRGHQFGYRNTANSWDSWSIEQFDQHFREQILFGANSFENTPFQDKDPSVVMKYPREEMNITLSKICEKYDADYWVWTPADVDLKDKKLRQAELERHRVLYEQLPRLDGVFFPGGDPGHNHPADVLPFLEELASKLKQYHPNAGIWISLQGFDEEKVNYFFNYVDEKNPDWLTGLVNGPSSPPIDVERTRLPKKYKLRHYADVTHSVRCSYPVKQWDQAFALTLGREGTNPQPLYYASIHNQYAANTDGFLTYSDGAHDDVNKVVWSQMGWNTKYDVKNVMVEYCSFFFGSGVAKDAADGIFALEQNWVGPIGINSHIRETLAHWKKLEAENPKLAGNWRWQQLVMRAYYDAYIQERNTYEKNLEVQANTLLANAKTTGADKAMDEALAMVQKADREFVAQDLKQKAVQYLDDLFHSVGLQSSVEKYHSSGAQRGCVLDFIDHPLNNRWWLEDEFKKIRQLKKEEEKLARLEFIRTYETPGEGSFYDNISSSDAKHVISETDDAIDYLWENEGFSRKRLSTQLFQFTPELQYNELDPNARYLIRVSGYGEALLRANGERLKPTKYEKGFEQFKEFPIPDGLIKEGKLKITFDKPDEEHLNWRQHSRVTDVWILKQL